MFAWLRSWNKHPHNHLWQQDEDNPYKQSCAQCGLVQWVVDNQPRHKDWYEMGHFDRTDLG